MLERLAKDKHSSLFWKFVHYGHKKFYNIGPLIRTFEPLFYNLRTVETLKIKILTVFQLFIWSFGRRCSHSLKRWTFFRNKRLIQLWNNFDTNHLHSRKPWCLYFCGYNQDCSIVSLCVFVTDSHFHPSLIFASKAGANLCGNLLRLHSLTLLSNVRLVWEWLAKTKALTIL